MFLLPFRWKQTRNSALNKDNKYTSPISSPRKGTMRSHFCQFNWTFTTATNEIWPSSYLHSALSDNMSVQQTMRVWSVIKKRTYSINPYKFISKENWNVVLINVGRLGGPDLLPVRFAFHIYIRALPCVAWCITSTLGIINYDFIRFHPNTKCSFINYGFPVAKFESQIFCLLY